LLPPDVAVVFAPNVAPTDRRCLSHLLDRIIEHRVRDMCIPCGRLRPAMAEDLTDDGERYSCHDRIACHRVTQVVQAYVLQALDLVSNALGPGPREACVCRFASRLRIAALDRTCKASIGADTHAQDRGPDSRPARLFGQFLCPVLEQGISFAYILEKTVTKRDNG